MDWDIGSRNGTVKGTPSYNSNSPHLLSLSGENSHQSDTILPAFWFFSGFLIFLYYVGNKTLFFVHEMFFDLDLFYNAFPDSIHYGSILFHISLWIMLVFSILSLRCSTPDRLFVGICGKLDIQS